MCDPVSMGAAQAGMSAVQNIMAFKGQQQAYKANVQAANVGFANTENSATIQAGQVDQQQSENTVSAMINAAAARGKISASASSMGGDAPTAAAQAGAAAFDVGRTLGIQDINSENQRVSIGQSLTTANIQRQAQINSVPKASVAGLLVNLAGSAMQGAQTALKLGGT